MGNDFMMFLQVHIPTQKLYVYENNIIVRDYSISTAKNGAGELNGSEMTPRGWHIIRAKIGTNQPSNTVFVKRRPTGEIYTPELRKLNPTRDWILTRIFWLSGLEPGKNRLANVDTMRRYVYFHGTPDENIMGTPGSRGCIRMSNKDMVELFDKVSVGTKVCVLG